MIVLRPDGSGITLHPIGIGIPVSEDVGHAEGAITTVLGVTDATTDSVVIDVLVSGGRIQADELDEMFLIGVALEQVAFEDSP